MYSLSIGANLINGTNATVGGFGHLQILFDAGFNNPLELEVQSPWNATAGNWVVRPVQFASENTPNYGQSGQYKEKLLFTGQAAADKWHILKQVAEQFQLASDGSRFKYDVDYNSNTYAATLLSVIGVSIFDHITDVTPSAVDSGFPGDWRNALNDSEYPGDAISLTLEGLDRADQIFGGNGRDIFKGNGGDDALWGRGGNDLLIGGGGDDSLFGGDGSADRIQFLGKTDEYEITLADNGALTVVDTVQGRDGTDRAIGVERLVFSDSSSSGWTIAEAIERSSSTGGGGNGGGGNGGATVYPDLTISADTIHTPSIFSGGSISVTVTVTNIGQAQSATAPTGLYLSRDQTPSSDDVLLGAVLTGTLSVGASITQTITRNAPDWGAGTYYVYAAADNEGAYGSPSSGRVYESDGTNNLSTVWSVNFSDQNGGNTDRPDLGVTAVSLNDNTVDAGQSVTVSYTVENVGTGSAIDTLAGIYLSTDGTISTSDTLLATQNSTSSNAPGSADPESQSVTLPNWLVSGNTYYIGVIVDYNNQESSESNESNNASVARAVNVNGTTSSEADLEITNTSLSSTNWVNGDVINVGFTIVNSGGTEAPNSRSGVYVSTNDNISTSDTLVYSESTGTMSAGEVNPEGGNFTLDLSSLGLSPGDYWVGTIADIDNDASESSDINNDDYADNNPIQITISDSSSALPDLSISNVRVNASNIVQGGSTTIYYEVVENNGVDSGGSRTGLYISTTQSFNQAVFLESDAVTVTANETDTESEVLDGLSAYGPGTYYLFAVADNDSEVDESNENNNVSAGVPITITAAAPNYDFSILSASLTASTIVQGQITSINYTVTNTGTSDTTAAVNQAYWASQNSTFGDSDDIFLTSDGAGYLSSNEVNSQTDSISSLSSLDAGTYNIFVKADYQNDFLETNENNNVRSAGVLTVSGLPDLSISSMTMDRTNIEFGDDTFVRFSIVNNGTAAASAFSMTGYISSNPSFDPTVDLPGATSTFRFSSGLAVGESSSQTVRLSDELDVGEYYLFLVADVGGEVNELSTSNNVSTGVSFSIFAPEPVGPTEQADSLSGTPLADTIDLLGGNDYYLAGLGNDTVFGGAGDDEVLGGEGDDMLSGGIGHDDLHGDGGNDRVFGGDGNDILRGGDGDDYIVGNDGDDLIDGGAGHDNLHGRAGNDWTCHGIVPCP